MEHAIQQEPIRKASDKKRDEFIAQIARMTMEEEYKDGDAPPSDDWIRTLSELIATARQIQKEQQDYEKDK